MDSYSMGRAVVGGLRVAALVILGVGALIGFIAGFVIVRCF